MFVIIHNVFMHVGHFSTRLKVVTVGREIISVGRLNPN